MSQNGDEKERREAEPEKFTCVPCENLEEEGDAAAVAHQSQERKGIWRRKEKRGGLRYEPRHRAKYPEKKERGTN